MGLSGLCGFDNKTAVKPSQTSHGLSAKVTTTHAHSMHDCESLPRLSVVGHSVLEKRKKYVICYNCWRDLHLSPAYRPDPFKIICLQAPNSDEYGTERVLYTPPRVSMDSTKTLWSLCGLLRDSSWTPWGLHRDSIVHFLLVPNTLWNQLRVIFAMQMEISLIHHIPW